MSMSMDPHTQQIVRNSIAQLLKPASKVLVVFQHHQDLHNFLLDTAEFYAGIGTYSQQQKTWTIPNRSKLLLAVIREPREADKLRGQRFDDWYPYTALRTPELFYAINVYLAKEPSVHGVYKS